MLYFLAFLLLQCNSSDNRKSRDIVSGVVELNYEWGQAKDSKLVFTVSLFDARH